MIIKQGLQSRTVKLLQIKKNVRLHDTPPWGVTPLYGIYTGMCSPKGYGFSAVLVINRVSILADFGHLGHSKKVWFLYSSLEMGMFLRSHHYQKEKQQKPFTNYVYGNFYSSELGNVL